MMGRGGRGLAPAATARPLRHARATASPLSSFQHPARETHWLCFSEEETEATEKTGLAQGSPLVQGAPGIAPQAHGIWEPAWALTVQIPTVCPPHPSAPPRKSFTGLPPGPPYLVHSPWATHLGTVLRGSP